MAAETHKMTRLLMPLSRWLALVALLVGFGGALYLGWHAVHDSILIPVPVRDLPAYYQIQPDDLVQQTYFPEHLATTTLRDTMHIVGRYTLNEVPHQQPLSDDQLGPMADASLISDTIAVGIPATPAMVLGGDLQAGNVVDILFVPAVSNTQPRLTPTRFEHLLVLDVKSVAAEKVADDLQPYQPYVIIVALPQGRRDEFLICSASETLLLARHNSP